ncbi:MAG: hypothetical protein LUD69_04650 [Oscillospiraceae bacterium]|nr:hypothetical protein [Oscillospiraceae bacterium]
MYEELAESVLWELPYGWKKTFVEPMCEELSEALSKAGLLEDYGVLQAKEKYGCLRWYDYGGNSETDEIICKYEDISEHTCVYCGAPATKMSQGYIAPWCDACAEEYQQRCHGKVQFIDL